MASDLESLSDLELLRLYEAEYDPDVSREVERRIRRDRGWLSDGYAIYLPADGGGIDRIALPAHRAEPRPREGLSGRSVLMPKVHPRGRRA